jgi:large subunit ribosomal protein L4
MKIKVYNLQGNETGEIELSDQIFDVKAKPELVHEVFTAQTNNQREPWADTKSKGEVRGGGKKPWAQKGTGRARHGSIRSPIWRGGGVTFGPRTERSYKTKINKKTRRLALKMILSDRVKNNAFCVVENFDFSEQKTKLFVEFLKVMPLKQKKFVVLTAGRDEKVIKMTNNIKNIKTLRAEDANVMELLNKPGVIISKAGVEKLASILK